MRKIYVFDTTLRDGEQVPGAKLNLEEKMRVAVQLEKLGVDFMEVGFPSSSQGDFDAVSQISRVIKESTVTALGRAVQKDIDCMYESLKYAENPMIHIVLGSSEVHISKKFRKTPEQIMQAGVNAVAYAKKYLPLVEYSLEDASRSDLEYMWKTIEAVVKAGATCINIPDTVGIAVPEKFGAMISTIHDRLMNLNSQVLLSVHCHNDTGMATANTLAAVRYGANKVECTMNGIGERAGNTSLEEVVMGIKAHGEYYDAYTDIRYHQIYETSRMVSRTMGLDTQVNKAIVGENAFAHSSGIHQDGLLKSKDVYEIFEPSEIGAPPMDIVLTARSGRHAFAHVASRLGYKIEEGKLEEVHCDFLKLADRKKEVYDSDVISLLNQNKHVIKKEEHVFWSIVDYEVRMGTASTEAIVKLRQNNQEVVSKGEGKDTVNALFHAIRKAVNGSIEIIDYRIQSIGTQEQGVAKVVVQIKCNSKDFFGKAIERDIIKSSVTALINAINRVERG